MAKILLVGSGFLGLYVTRDQLSLDNEVTIIDKKEPSSVLNHPLLEQHRNSPKLKYKWKSAGDTMDMAKEIKDYDVIVYTAAIADVPYAMQNPLDTVEVNVKNTTAFMEMLRLNDFAGRIILMSSESVYGKQAEEDLPIKEDKVIPKPINPYGATKLAQEVMVSTYGRCYGLKTVILRSATMFGPYSRLKQAMPIWVGQMLENKDVTLEGDGCLPAGETVFANPAPKCIEQFKAGDKVLTKSGFGYVTKTFERDYDGKMYEIKAQGMFPFKVTDNHPVLVMRMSTTCEYPVKHKCRPDCFCLKYHEKANKAIKKVRSDCKHNIREVHDIEKPEPRWVRAKEVGIGDYLVIPKFRGGTPQILDLSEHIMRFTGSRAKKYRMLDLNEDWAYLIGLYIADGWTSKQKNNKRKVCYSLNVGEDDHVLAKVKSILDKYGFPSYIRNRGGAYEISFNFSWFGRWLEKNAGVASYEKRVPGIIFELPEKETAAFIEGLIDGDGCEVDYGLALTSTSKTLLIQAQVLLTKLGRWGSIHWGTKLRGISTHICGILEYGNEVRTRHWIDSDNLYIPVTHVTETDFQGKVYNIETTDNTYCTPAVVHNSSSRDFCYVVNTVEAIKLTIETPGIDGEVFNIGSGEEMIFSRMLGAMQTILQSKSKIVNKPWRPGEKGLRVALDISKAQERLKYTVHTRTLDGIKDFAPWYAFELLHWDLSQMDKLLEGFGIPEIQRRAFLQSKGYDVGTLSGEKPGIEIGVPDVG